MYPQWISDLFDLSKSRVAHFFILHGNVYDKYRLDGEYKNIFQCLESLFKQNSLIMRYSRTAGLGFANQAMEEFFVQYYVNQAGAPKASPVASMKENFDKQSGKSPVERWLGEEPFVAMQKLEKILSGSEADAEEIKSKRKVLIIDFAHNLASSGQNQQQQSVLFAELWERWSRKVAFGNNNAIVILLTRHLSDLSDNLLSADSKIKSLRLPKPNQEARQACWLDNLIKKNGVKVGADLVDDGKMEKIARITNGLSLEQIDEIYQTAKHKQQIIDLSLLRTAKQQILEKEFGNRLDVKMPQWGFAYFGGKPELKSYMLEVRDNILAGVNRRVPMGMAAIGSPGTGKTFFFECFAYECGFNFVEIRNPRSMWQGESEGIMDKILSALDDLAPVIVIEDEADQSETSRDMPSGDSGVANRLRQKKFEFCSDPKRRGNVIWVRISNRYDLIDAAYKRKGRTDVSIPFLLPEVDEYRQIFQVMFDRYQIPQDKELQDDQQWQEIIRSVQNKEYCTGADIEWMVLEADAYSGRDQRETVSFADLKRAVKDWRLESDPREIDRQLIIAYESSSTRLLPKDYEARLKAIKQKYNSDRATVYNQNNLADEFYQRQKV